MKIKIINNSGYDLISYATEGSAGIDLKVSSEWDKRKTSKWLEPNQRLLVPTGIFIELPVGYEAQIRPRSGLALKHGITVLNSPGTIDSDYRGEIGVILINTSNEPFMIKSGERICQMVITKYEKVELEETTTLYDTERGSGGFGHTGKI